MAVRWTEVIDETDTGNDETKPQYCRPFKHLPVHKRTENRNKKHADTTPNCVDDGNRNDFHGKGETIKRPKVTDGHPKRLKRACEVLRHW